MICENVTKIIFMFESQVKFIKLICSHNERVQILTY